MRGIWAGYPLTVQLRLDQLYMFTFYASLERNTFFRFYFVNIFFFSFLPVLLTLTFFIASSESANVGPMLPPVYVQR